MNQRLERVNRLLRDEISDILRRDIHDPLIGFVTITEVDVAPDLRFAKVFFSVLGDAEQVKAGIKGLLRARKYINARIAERVELRHSPKLRFLLDDTAARAQAMERRLHEEHEKFGDAPAVPPAALGDVSSRPRPGEDFDPELAEDELADEDFADVEPEDDDLEDEDFGEDDLDDEEAR